MRSPEKELTFIVVVFLFIVVAHTLLGCAKAHYNDPPEPPPPPVVETQPATPQQCPHGGTQVTLGTNIVVVCEDTKYVRVPVCIITKKNDDHNCHR